jgi:hypothetical protein
MHLSERLHKGHDTSAFKSSKEPLDTWLQLHALNVAAKRIGSTFVWHENGVVVAYHTLSAHLLTNGAVPRNISRGDPDQIPPHCWPGSHWLKSCTVRGWAGSFSPRPWAGS